MIQATDTEPTDVNGRSENGRFAPGNSFARGNPTARHAQRLRQLFVTAVSEDDIRAIVAKLVELAKSGDIQAANLLLTRALGKPSTSDNSLPIDSIPITSPDQIRTIDDAREYVSRINPDMEESLAERKAQLFVAIAQSKDRVA
jgi:hypothetical protein